MKEERIGRWLFTSEGLKEGYMRVVEGAVEEVCEGCPPSGTTSALLLPGLVNAHVHLGDSVAYPAPKGTVQEIVGPPNGHKHRILRATPAKDKIAAMRNASSVMVSSGTALFGDFREEGVEGVRALRSALKDSPISARIFGRPSTASPEDSEIEVLLRESDGVGMSSLRDWPYDLLRHLSERARESRKTFSMHASETVREDMDKILDLKPDFLVHLCKASQGDLESCANNEVPVVVCPTSNQFFGLDPGVSRLLKAGVTVAIGTDNGMIALPDMIEEMKTGYRMSGPRQGISPADIVRLATFNGRKVLNAEPKITTEINSKSDIVAIRVSGKDPLLELVTVARSDDIVGMAFGGEFRRTRAWMR